MEAEANSEMAYSRFPNHGLRVARTEIIIPKINKILLGLRQLAERKKATE